jgi:hypothetical protein
MFKRNGFTPSSGSYVGGYAYAIHAYLYVCPVLMHERKSLGPSMTSVCTLLMYEPKSAVGEPQLRVWAAFIVALGVGVSFLCYYVSPELAHTTSLYAVSKQSPTFQVL